MSELLMLLATSLAFLLEPGRFRIVNSSSAHSFGDASLTLQSGGLRLELIRDRSENSIRFQPVAGPTEEWFWLGVLRRSLDGDRPGSDQLDASAIDFMQRWLDDLEKRAASDEQRTELIEELKRTRQERSEELFG